MLSLLEQRIQNEYFAGHLPTRLKGLDAALCGGIPFGALTELVGPSGIGKTQVRKTKLISSFKWLAILNSGNTALLAFEIPCQYLRLELSSTHIEND